MKNSLKALLVVFIAAENIACSKGGGNGAAYGPMNIKLQEVSTGQCLNMGLVADKMALFSPSVAARFYTTRILIDSSDEKARPQFPSFIVRSNFVFQDQAFSELSPFQKVNQSGCEQATIVDRQGTTEIYQVKESGEDFIVLGAGDDKTIRYQLLTPQSMAITTRYTAIDVCHWQTLAKVEHTRILKWGGDEIFVPAETVTTDLLRRVSQTLTEVPPEISNLVAEIEAGAQGDAIEIGADQLRGLLNAPVKADVLTCPGHVPDPDRAPTPSPDEERATMTGNPTPTPTPTPPTNRLDIM
jgi:hypothetical protein